MQRALVIKKQSLSLVVVCLFALGACSKVHHQGDASQRVLEELRARAKEHPKDPTLWRELAIAEQLEDGGDPKRAHEALAHAKKLGASGLDLAFIEAEEHVLEGRAEAAL